MDEPKVEYLTLHALSVVLNDKDAPYEKLVEIVKKDKYLSKLTNKEVDDFLVKLLEKLNT